MIKIEPSIAAHNIANAYITNYLKTQKDSAIYDYLGPEINDLAKASVQLYETVYDIVYEHVDNSNSYEEN